MIRALSLSLYLVELRLLQVVPLELRVEVVERLHADVVEVAENVNKLSCVKCPHAWMQLRNPPDLGELGGVRSQRGRRRHQHLEVLLQVRRDQLQVRLSQRLELKL